MHVQNEQKKPTPKQLLWVIPLLIFPFLTFLLWSLGVIGAKPPKAVIASNNGFNANLPNALASRDSSFNKMEFYEQSDRDSAKYWSLRKNDPNFQRSATGNSFLDTILNDPADVDPSPIKKLSYDPYPSGMQNYQDPNEEKVFRKLSELQQEMNKKHPAVASELDSMERSPRPPAPVNPDIDRLESMMQSMQHEGDGDPEMNKINGMLEKILDIQHPERVQEKTKLFSASHKMQVFPVATAHTDNISLLSNKERLDVSPLNDATVPSSGFFSDNSSLPVAGMQNAIPANFPALQVLVTGSTVKLQLATNIYVNGILIPKGHFLYGVSSLSGDRLHIEITALQFANNILPVNLSAYDLDGIEGIYIPGSITRDVTKQSTDQAIQSMSLASLDPSLGAQAASAGIEAAKSLIGKKVKLVKVTVKASYQVLLKDNNQRN